MVIDSSAIIAILYEEPEANLLVQAISSASVKLMSAGTALELFIVTAAKKGEIGKEKLLAFLTASKIEIIPFDTEQLEIARDAFAKYGKGNHKAKLNFGDCFAYALAKASGEPLLFKGNDFSLTDIEPAIK